MHAAPIHARATIQTAALGSGGTKRAETKATFGTHHANAAVRGLPSQSRELWTISSATQIAAVRAALRRAEEEILRDHVASCVDEAIHSGNRADQRRKIAELMDVVGRAER